MKDAGTAKREITLGSLFDGAGGFPLAGTLAGITPRWASEIEPFPIRVTTKRFPDMKHIGNITEVSGADIEPVDIITFGSPCQDLSVANCGRKGLQGARSGLFLEAIRIIKEMREKTHGRKPKFVVWENVVGAFSSNGGEDFRIVLEEIAKIKDPSVRIPRYPDGRWPYAGENVGDGYSIAWRTVDAQFWGVPQRRRRIYLVADFGGSRAGKIQFECDRLCGNFTAGAGEGQETAGTAGGGAYPAIARSLTARNDGSPCLDRGPNIVLQPVTAVHLTQDPITSEGIAPCLSTGNPTSGQATVGVMMPVAYRLVSKASNAWKSGNPYSGCVQTDTAQTLDTSGGDATRNQGGNLIVAPAVVYENHGQDSRCKPMGDVSETVVAKYGTGGNNTPLVVQPAIAIGRDYKTVEAEVAQTLTRSDVPGMVVQPYCIGNGQVQELALLDKARTLNCMHDAQAAIVPADSGGFPYIVRRLMPLECCRLQGYPDGWAENLDTPEPTEEEIDWWCEVFETHRKAVKPDTKPKSRNQVRKWLQNPHSDSAECKMWGNSLAIPNAYHVLAGIAEEIRTEPQPSRGRTDGQITLWEVLGMEVEEAIEPKEQRESYENAVFVCLVEAFATPGPYIPDCVSVREMAGMAEHPGSKVYGMTEREIRNACRRLKRRGLIKRAWQKENPDQPSGEYGEVWDDSPFIPRHGYGITKAGWDTALAKETEKRVTDEFTEYWSSKLSGGDSQ